MTQTHKGVVNVGVVLTAEMDAMLRHVAHGTGESLAGVLKRLLLGPLKNEFAKHKATRLKLSAAELEILEDLRASGNVSVELLAVCSTPHVKAARAALVLEGLGVKA